MQHHADAVLPVRVLLIALALASLLPGCSDAELHPVAGDDTKTPLVSHARECDAAPTEDTSVPLGATCDLPAADWTLVERWRQSFTLPDTWAVMTARFRDTDGDGTVTIDDAVELLSVTSDRFGHAPTVVSGDGTVSDQLTELEGGWYVSVGDLDAARPGAEFVAAGMLSDETSCSMANASPDGVEWIRPNDEASATGSCYGAWLADWDADGTPDLVGSSTVTTATEGDLIYSFSDADHDMLHKVAVDLDRDGLPELVTDLDHEPLLLDATGQHDVCPIYDESHPYQPDGLVTVAVANLDDDDEGEVAVASNGLLAICNADGTLQAEVNTGSTNTTELGVGRFHDGGTELVADEYRAVDTSPASVAAYNTDLSLRWRTPIPDAEGRVLFTLADLDGDGLHEVIAQAASGTVYILGPDGAILTASDGGPRNGGFDPPLVADVDGDGLAELIVGGQDVAMFENAAGGWPVNGAEDPSTGWGHFPGDRLLDGSMPPASTVPWDSEAANVWQGLPAGPPALPLVEASVSEACSDDCRTTRFIVWVTNSGAADASGPVTVDLERLDDGAVLASTMLPRLASGVRHPVTFEVETSQVGQGVTVEIQSTWAQCANLAEPMPFTDLPCH